MSDLHFPIFHKKLNNVCLIKIRSKHSSNTLLSLLRIFMRQTLVCISLIVFYFSYLDRLCKKCSEFPIFWQGIFEDLVQLVQIGVGSFTNRSAGALPLSRVIISMGLLFSQILKYIYIQ